MTQKLSHLYDYLLTEVDPTNKRSRIVPNSKQNSRQRTRLEGTLAVNNCKDSTIGEILKQSLQERLSVHQVASHWAQVRLTQRFVRLKSPFGDLGSVGKDAGGFARDA